MKKTFIPVFVAIFLSGCHNNQEKNIAKEDNIIQEIKSPAVHESSEPNLHLSKDGTIYLTWIETLENKNSVLYYSTLNNEEWSKPVEIAEGNNWFVNWADFPSISGFGNNSLAANFLVKSGKGTYAYDINLTISNDGGKTWSNPIVPHSDNTPTEHGFVSLLPIKDEDFMAIWLDGRKYATENKEMTLRSAIINKSGNIIDEYVLDERVCDCCPTDAVSSEDAIIVVYRDRSENEIRDILSVCFQNGKWSDPNIVSQDKWKINGCPVNGPAIDALGKNVGVAWFTMANENPKVKVSFSEDLGKSFNNPIVVNEKRPLGRVDISYMQDGSVYVSWMEEDEQDTYIKVRKIHKDGRREKAITVSKTSSKRASGFPKMVGNGKDLLFAWTHIGENTAIKTTMMKMPDN